MASDRSLQEQLDLCFSTLQRIASNLAIPTTTQSTSVVSSVSPRPEASNPLLSDVASPVSAVTISSSTSATRKSSINSATVAVSGLPLLVY